MPRTARWRLTRQARRNRRPYFTLVKGSKLSMALGYVSPDAAKLALETIQAEDDAGTQDRVLRLYHREPQKALVDAWGLVGDDECPDVSEAPGKAATGRAMAIRYLCSEEIDWPEMPPDYGSFTVREYFNEVFWQARNDPANPEGAGPETCKMEAGCWRRILASEVGMTRLRDLDEWVFERFIQARLRDVAPATVRRDRTAYQALLRFAHRRGDVKSMHKFFRLKGGSRRTRPQVEPLSVDEVLRLLEHAGSPRDRALWGVSVAMGLRPAEARRVRWEDIDWQAQEMLVRGSKTDGSRATVPMTEPAYREMRAYWMMQGQPSEGHAFKSRHGNALSASAQRLALIRDVERAGIDRAISPNVLRASFATIAWALGIEYDVARRITRHKNPKILKDVYTRPTPETLRTKLAAFTWG